MRLNTLVLADMSFGDYSVMVLYLLAVMGVGVWFSRRNSDTESYLLGGRNMPWWLIGISYVVSLLSTLTMVGVPGEAYTNGVTLAVGEFMSPLFTILAFHIFVRFYFVNQVFTPFEYLGRRFGLGIRALAAGYFWLSRVIYIGLVLYASAKVFTGTNNWPVWITILTVDGVGTLYTLLGGFKAVVWSDFIQFTVLIGGVGLVVVYAVAEVPGGAVGVITHAYDLGSTSPSRNFIYHMEAYRFWVQDTWTEVLANDEHGNTLSGSWDELADAQQGGREIKVAIGGLCNDLGDGPFTEVLAPLGSGFAHTTKRIYEAQTHPVVRVAPTIPMGYGSGCWDVSWVIVRTDGSASIRSFDPYTRRFRDWTGRFPCRWFVR